MKASLAVRSADSKSVSAAAALMFCGALAVAACGGSDAPPVETRPVAASPAKAAKDRRSTDLEPGASGDARMANAVATADAGAAIDLQYDLAAGPAAGQAFELMLSFAPHQAADSLEVELSGLEGLIIVNAGEGRFAPVQAGSLYASKLLLSAQADGLYYVNVTARLVNKVQTDARSFSVPIVVGAEAAARRLVPTGHTATPQPESAPAVAAKTAE